VTGASPGIEAVSGAQQGARKREIAADTSWCRIFLRVVHGDTVGDGFVTNRVTDYLKHYGIYMRI
jgi:hypothetical protein